MTGQQYITLSQLAARIQGALQDEFFGGVWVVAEIGRLTKKRHYYMELVEQDDSGKTVASITGMIWANKLSMVANFERETGRSFDKGIKILFYAWVTYHPVYGLSLQIDRIDPSYTLGELELKRKQIIERLAQEGLIKLNKSLSLPIVIQRIAIISSETAAGYEDFVNQLENNQAGIKFYHELFAAYMQGENTRASIVAALEKIKQEYGRFDVVVIVRGGGSSTDLGAFDDEELARAIATFPLPVLTGIGHTRDKSVIDHVAHTNLKTPTAVAEFILDRNLVYLEAVISLTQRLDNEVKQYLANQSLMLGNLRNRLEQGVTGRLWQEKYGLQVLGTRFRKTTDLIRKNILDVHLSKQALETAVKTTLQRQYELLARQKDNLETTLSRQIALERNNIEKLKIFIEQNDPQKILKQGFSITLVNGKILTSVEQAAKGDKLETWLVDGKVQSTVTDKNKQK